MLDQAYGLTMTSRLSCQIKLTKELNNMLVKLPAATRNFYVVSSKRFLMMVIVSFVGIRTDTFRSPIRRVCGLAV
jgi:hypothetical protein